MCKLNLLKCNFMEWNKAKYSDRLHNLSVNQLPWTMQRFGSSTDSAWWVAVWRRPSINTSLGGASGPTATSQSRQPIARWSQAARGLFAEVLAAPQRHKRTQRGGRSSCRSAAQSHNNRHVTGRVEVHFKVGTDRKCCIVGLINSLQTSGQRTC